MGLTKEGVKYPMVYTLHGAKYPIICPVHGANYPEFLIVYLKKLYMSYISEICF